MPRPKGSKNKTKEEVKATEILNEEPELDGVDDSEDEEPEDEYISAFQAADRLNTTEPTIKIWVDHGHLKQQNGMISARSIRECRFNTRRMI